MIKSLRWRMQAWHALILLSVLIVYGSIVYYLQWRSRVQDLDLRLELTGDHVISRLYRNFAPDRRFRRNNRGERVNERPPPHEALHTRSAIVLPMERMILRQTGDVNQSFQNHFTLVSAQAPVDPPPARNPSLLPPLELPPRPPGHRRPEWGKRGELFEGPLLELAPNLSMNVEDLIRLGFPEELAMLFDPEQSSPYYFSIWDHRGRLTLKTSTSPDRADVPSGSAPDSTLVHRSFHTRNGNREMTMIHRTGFKMVLGESLTPSLRAQHTTGLGLLLSGAGVLMIGLVGGNWISNRAISPIRQMTSTAESISARNLSERIDIKETDSELGSLAAVLNQTFERLEEAFEQQSRFTSDASHELRTPVSVLLSQTELTLSRQRSPEEYREALETCRRTALRMRTLVEGLLFLARMDAGKGELEFDRFDLGSIVNEMLDDLQPLTEERELTLNRNLRKTLIRSNRPRIQQVLTNLIANAIRYNRQGGEIQVDVREESERAVLLIRDTGIGISEQDLPHVFERFYRVDKARTIADGGTGLGLAICKMILESLKGTIEIESRLDSGTTVKVSLPLEQARTETFSETFQS